MLRSGRWSDEEENYLTSKLDDIEDGVISIRDVANKLRRRIDSVYNKFYALGGKHVPYNTREYALYKGEEILAMGTVSQIAEELGVKKESISFYATPSYAKRTSENARRLVRI